jgi:hypothetical protein
VRRPPGAAAASVALFLVACGAPPVPPPPPAETVIGREPDKAAVPPKTLVELRREFVAICTLKVPDLPDYCECSWEQMAKTFSAAEMTSPTADLGKQRVLKERIETNCPTKPLAR